MTQVKGLSYVFLYYENDIQQVLGCYWHSLYQWVSKCKMIPPTRQQGQLGEAQSIRGN